MNQMREGRINMDKSKTDMSIFEGIDNLMKAENIMEKGIFHPEGGLIKSQNGCCYIFCKELLESIIGKEE